MVNTRSNYNITREGNYTVYLVLNKHNGKSYVGYTVTSSGLRWSNHKQAAKKGSQTRFYHAIRKYGADAFEVIELAVFYGTREEAWKVERFYIEALSTHTSGYNSNNGGSGGWVVKDKEAWLKNRSVAGTKNPRHNGKTDDDLLIIMKRVYDKHGEISSRKSREWLVSMGFPKHLSACRFPGSQTSPRHYGVFSEKYQIEPSQFLTKKALESWQRLNPSNGSK